jgi:superfamily I DNA and RNA helicase
LIQARILTLSFIHSVQGYDASIVFLMGTDRLDGDETEHRATLYVGATRAKFQLLVSGVQRDVPTLLDEIATAVEVLKGDDPQQVSKSMVSGFFRECKECGLRELYHVNTPLDSLSD